MLNCIMVLVPFFFNDAAATWIYTLSLHDALPILLEARGSAYQGLSEYHAAVDDLRTLALRYAAEDRKSTRLNSSHQITSYAVFCLKTKIQRMKALIRRIWDTARQSRRESA